MAQTHATPRLIAGAMSGTSADGVDVALTRVTGRGLDMKAELVRHHHRPYDPALRASIFQLRDSGQTSLSDLAGLGRAISLTYALTVNEALSGANLKASDLAAVAAHGQTLYHAPPDTIQWLDPALIAAEVGCVVVSDFRRADCAAGGQGAPLVPFADYLLFRHPTKNRVLLNIGGIANVTWLKAGGALSDVIAFDTGPGNCLSDWAVRTYFPHLPGYDEGGRIAAEDVVSPHLDLIVDGFMVHSFFSTLPPKSTDTPTMTSAFVAAVRSSRVEDFLQTEDMEELARNTIVRAGGIAAVRAIVDGIAMTGNWPEDLIVSGGGTRNLSIMRHLAEYKGGSIIYTTDELGIPSDAKEAIAFALLAAATLDGEPSNVPSVTGAKRAVVLGSITPRP